MHALKTNNTDNFEQCKMVFFIKDPAIVHYYRRSTILDYIPLFLASSLPGLPCLLYIQYYKFFISALGSWGMMMMISGTSIQYFKIFVVDVKSSVGSSGKG